MGAIKMANSRPALCGDLVHQFLSRQEPIDRPLVDLAYDVTCARQKSSNSGTRT